MKFVLWEGSVVTASDSGNVGPDSRVVATATAVPGMVMIPAEALLSILNAPEVLEASSAAMKNIEAEQK